MSETLRKPEEKTMALGGVATGSMKAKEALRVQGIITYSGFSRMDWAWTGTHRIWLGSAHFYPTTCRPHRIAFGSVQGRYHGGEDGEEERCRGDVAGALCEGGDEEAEDGGDGPRRDGVERRHLSAEPAGETRHLSGKTPDNNLDLVATVTYPGVTKERYSRRPPSRRGFFFCGKIA